MSIAIVNILETWEVARTESHAPMETGAIVLVIKSATVGDVSNGEIGLVRYIANATTLAHMNKTDSGAQMG